MRSILQLTLNFTRALLVVLAAALILAAPAHAQVRGGGGARGGGFRAPVGQQPGRPAENGALLIVPDWAFGWWNYPYNGVAYTPYGVIQYTPCGYGWTLPGYFIPY
jgi:hypothetical protein